MISKSLHARKRIIERNITKDDIARALSGIIVHDEMSNETLYLDRKNRTYLITCDNNLVTAYKMKPKQVKKLFSSVKQSRKDFFDDDIKVYRRSKKSSDKAKRINNLNNFNWLDEE